MHALSHFVFILAVIAYADAVAKFCKDLGLSVSEKGNPLGSQTNICNALLKEDRSPNVTKNIMGMGQLTSNSL